MLPEFDLLMPQTLSEALALLADYAPDAVPLAGGTNLIVDMRGRRHTPSVLVNVNGLDALRGIRQEDGHIVVGGGTTIAQILRDPLISSSAGALREAARVFANPLIRNRATIGGNLVYGSPAANTPPPLLLFDAEVELTSRESVRCVPLEDFLIGVRHTDRRPDELLTAVRWSLPPERTATAFYKVGLRKSDAIAVVSVAVRVTWDDGQRCEVVRIALGSVAPRVIRAHAAEELLTGELLNEDIIAEVAHRAAEATSCVSDIRGSAAYRYRTTAALVRRLLTQLAGEVQ